MLISNGAIVIESDLMTLLSLLTSLARRDLILMVFRCCVKHFRRNWRDCNKIVNVIAAIFLCDSSKKFIFKPCIVESELIRVAQKFAH